MSKDKLIKTKYTLTRQSISERYVCKLKSDDCTVMSHFNVCPWLDLFFKEHYFSGKKSRNPTQIQSENFFLEITRILR